VAGDAGGGTIVTMGEASANVGPAGGDAGELERRAAGVRRIHRVSVAAAAVVVALAVASVVTRPMPCGDLPSTYPPILAFELARSSHDLLDIFGPVGEPCRRHLIAVMDSANLVDIALFTPAYALFLIAAFVGLGRRGRPWARVGVGLAALAAAADVGENLCLFALTPALSAQSSAMAALPWATGVKWLALGGAGLAAAVALWPGERRHHQVSAALCMITPLATIAAIVDPHRFGPLVGTGVAASWLMLLAVGVVQARARGAGATR
jgi:hypothetical protein